jgi:hypothetical protein
MKIFNFIIKNYLLFINIENPKRQIYCVHLIKNEIPEDVRVELLILFQALDSFCQFRVEFYLYIFA